MSGLLLRTPIGVYGLRDIAQPRVRIQRCLGKSPARANIKNRQNLERAIYSPGRCEINHSRRRGSFHGIQAELRQRPGRTREGSARTQRRETKEEGREGGAAQSRARCSRATTG